MNIKDSGERTTFNTGAQRDMHSGKGRMDLLPWAAIIEVSKHYAEGTDRISHLEKMQIMQQKRVRKHSLYL